MGIDQIPLDLLEHQEHHHEPQRLPGVVDGDEQRPHAAADEGPHDGDQGRQGDEDAHQQRVGHPEDGHGHREERAQDAGLQALAGEEAGEGPVGQPQDLQCPVRLLQGQQAVDHLPAVAGELLLLQQDVEGEDQADDKGADPADHSADEPAAGGDDAAPHRLHVLQGVLCEALPVDLLLRQPLLDGGQDIGEVIDLGLEPGKGGGDLIHDGHGRLAHAGTDDEARQCQHTDDGQQRQHQCHRPPEPGRPAAAGAHVPLDGPHGHVQHEGQSPAQQEGGEDSEDPPGSSPYHIQILQDTVKRRAAADHQQKALDALFVPLHER